PDLLTLTLSESTVVDSSFVGQACGEFYLHQIRSELNFLSDRHSVGSVVGGVHHPTVGGVCSAASEAIVAHFLLELCLIVG
ncbi:hypothetical protein, partial [Klebsiella pneumoniae]|uniref:hypothetical protein n=1 Tax=Klebsiella pneumoniae TaxID=573 RepID=UPI00226E0A09